MNWQLEEAYDLITQDAVTVSERIDITDKVIEVLDKK
ncbi:OmpH family outer membrane protein [Oligella ureolytica]